MQESRIFQFPFIDHNAEMQLEEELQAYLEKIGKIYLFQTLSYILKEMIGNANKANYKRIYFRLNNLDLRKETDYQKGMQNFKEEIIENTEKYMENAKKLGFFVKICFFKNKDSFVIAVINNSTLTPQEKARIDEKFRQVKQFKTIEDAYQNVIDTTEGGGIGFVLTLLMLKKIGVNENSVVVLPKEKETEVRLHIPLDLVESAEEEMVSDLIIREIDSIPQFPNHILLLQSALNDPNADFNSLAPIIQKDPVLIADLLKTANSVMYALPRKVNTIEDAVKLIGFKGIRNLVITYTTQNLLMKKYRLDIIQKQMEHSAEVAFYAQELARLFKLRTLSDDAYIGGILHDIGKILVQALKPDLIEHIEKTCYEKNIDKNILENLTNGYNHSLIGSKLAEKWNFPDSIIEMIKYHHSPLQASKEHFQSVAIVYLANMIAHIRLQEYDFSHVSGEALQIFNIHYEQEFNKICENLFKSYNEKVGKK